MRCFVLTKMSPPSYPIVSAKVSQRRSFIVGSASLAIAVFSKERVFSAVKNMPKFSSYPFSLGVASGDPTSEGMVIWTRLAPQPLQGGGMEPVPVEVSWQVAEDVAMSKVVRQGKAIATPEWGHSVHVEVDLMIWIPKSWPLNLSARLSVLAETAPSNPKIWRPLTKRIPSLNSTVRNAVM